MLILVLCDVVFMCNVVFECTTMCQLLSDHCRQESLMGWRQPRVNADDVNLTIKNSKQNYHTGGQLRKSGLETGLPVQFHCFTQLKNMLNVVLCCVVLCCVVLCCDNTCVVLCCVNTCVVLC